MNDLDRIFPRLSDGDYAVTSSRTAGYNCIAWAAGDGERWWWPDRLGMYYWPLEVAREESLSAVLEAYSTLGYAQCDHGDPEDGAEKIALFADEWGRPTHAARQLPSGRWTSKCGKLEDIEHELEALAGGPYGEVICYLRRGEGARTTQEP